MKNIKAAAVKDWTAAKTITRNAFEFLDAVCLMTVSVYAIYESLTHGGLWYMGLRIAGLVIALQASVLLVRHFNK